MTGRELQRWLAALPDADLDKEVRARCGRVNYVFAGSEALWAVCSALEPSPPSTAPSVPSDPEA